MSVLVTLPVLSNGVVVQVRQHVQPELRSKPRYSVAIVAPTPADPGDGHDAVAIELGDAAVMADLAMKVRAASVLHEWLVRGGDLEEWPDVKISLIPRP